MKNEQISDFYHSLISFMVLSKQQVIAIGAKHDLTPMQAHVLFLINPDNPQPMSHLSSLLSCDASNITGLIDGLEHKELIYRVEKPGDRRVKMIALKPSGAALRQQFLAELTKVCEEHLFQTFTAQEKQEFARLINKTITACPNSTK